MAVTIQQESFADFAPQARGLMPVYEAENKMIYDNRPDWAQYKALADAGNLQIITARDEGIIIGYFVVLLTPNIGCVGERLAFGATLYLHPAYRKGTTIGVRLIKAAEDLAKRYKADTIMISSPAKAPIDALLERKGYVPQETMFGRRL